MTNNIVVVNVTEQVAPTPSQLQKTGAFISQGGTTLNPGTKSLLTQLSDLDAILVAPRTLNSLSWDGVVTATAASPHGYPIGSTVDFTLAGFTPSGYDGPYTCTIIGPDQFTYTQDTNPGPMTVAGTYQAAGGANSTLSWDSDVVTATAIAPHGLPVGSTIPITIAGATPSAYNGSGLLATVISSTDFTYALIGDPGTETVPGTYSPDAEALTLASWQGLVSATTTDPHGYTVGSSEVLTIADATPNGYNGSVTATFTGASTFTYPLSSDPGTETSAGTYVPKGAVDELVAMAKTFFAQGAQQAVYILELGAGTPAQGVTALDDFITVSPQFFYSYLVPRSWADESTFISFIAGFEALTKKTYFWVTVTSSNFGSFTPLMKCVVTMIEAPGIPVTEFSLAAAFWVSLHYDPSQTNKVTPFAFSYLFGVTQYPIVGNNAFLATLKAAFVNWIGTGAEGGISNTTLFWGTTMDGNDFTFWYSVDWVQINGELDLANAVINGSNNPQNPLYYNQNGINRLQAVAVKLMSSGIAFGLVLGDIAQAQLDASEFQKALDAGTYVGKTLINAVPFIPYSKANPGDYKIGKYGGLSVAYVPARGFTMIVFNLNVSQFVAQ